MRVAIIIVVLFTVIAFDLTRNDGRLIHSFQGFGYAVLRDVGLG
jgi:hypothetical protein